MRVLSDEVVVMTESLQSEDTAESSVLRTLVVLAERWRFIGGGMLFCGLITALIVLVMPVTYTASTVILTSQSGSGGAAALLGELGGSLGALASLGGGGLFGKSIRYLCWRSQQSYGGRRNDRQISPGEGV